MARGFFFPFLVNYITSGSAVILIKQTIKKKLYNADEVRSIQMKYSF